MENGEYIKGPTNTVHRRAKEYAKYDVDLIHGIVNSTSVLHVSFVPDPSTLEPVILPMLGQIGTYNDASQPSCYLHGYVSSRLMRLGAASSIPICICATKVDGLVLALTPFSHSCNYRSAILHGHATFLDGSTEEGMKEKLWAMELVTNSVVDQRWENSRVPPEKAELTTTGILKVEIESASAKVRDFGPNDDKKERRKEDVMERVWTGVVPVWEQLGEPVPGSYNQVEGVPAYLKEFVDGKNQEARKYALETAAAEVPAKKKKGEDE